MKKQHWFSRTTTHLCTITAACRRRGVDKTLVGHEDKLLQPVVGWLVSSPVPCAAEADGMRLAAAKPAAITVAQRQPIPIPTCSSSRNQAKKSRRSAWRVAVASRDAADGDAEAGAGQGQGQAPTGRRARLSARRRQRVPLPDGVSGAGVGEFLRHPDAVESILNTGALESFAPAGPGTFTCALRRVGLLGFEVAPVLDLRVAPTSTDCTIEMLSCRVRTYARGLAASSLVSSVPRALRLGVRTLLHSPELLLISSSRDQRCLSSRMNSSQVRSPTTSASICVLLFYLIPSSSSESSTEFFSFLQHS
jgi:hypothetical protein